MKNNLYHINFGNSDDLATEAKRAMKRKEKRAHSAMFENLNEFMGFMFPGKFMLLMLIKASSPNSMYELAQLVDRSQSGVLRDCKELEAMGFIILSQEGPRNAMKPSLSFAYDTIVVHTKIGDCEHRLPSVA